MPTLRELHELAVEEAIDADPRDQDEIDRELEHRQDRYDDLDGIRREQYDEDRLENPFDDSKILYGGDQDMSTVAVGIDITVSDLMLVDRLNEQDHDISGVIAHHPSGRAYARLPEVMQLQIDALAQAGVTVSQAEWVIRKSARETTKRLHARNHPRTPQAAELLDLPLACMHTTGDNLAYRFTKDYLAEEDPYTLNDLIDALLELPEFRWALQYGIEPRVFAGAGDHRVGNLGVLGYTGGTDPEDDMIPMLVDAGVDTLVAMHATQEQIDQAEEHHLNVISTGHMAADSLGMNLLLDRMQEEFNLAVVPMSGFERVER